MPCGFSTIPTRDFLLGFPWLCEISREEGLRIVHRATRVVAWRDASPVPLDALGRIVGHKGPYLRMILLARELNHPGTVTPAQRRLAADASETVTDYTLA